MTLARVMRRFQQLVGVGTTKTAPSDGGNVQTVQAKLSDLDVRDRVPVAFHFGFSAGLPVGTEVVVLTIAGDPSSSVVVASNNQSLRFKSLAPGEAVIYDAFGRSVRLGPSGIDVEAANGPVTVNAATNVTITASVDVTITAADKVRMVTPRLEVTGDIVDHCDTLNRSMAGDRVIYNSHTHNETGTVTHVPNQLE